MANSSPVTEIPIDQCPLCYDWEERLRALHGSDSRSDSILTTTLGTFRRHVGAHLEQIALFSITPSLDPSLETVSNEGSVGARPKANVEKDMLDWQESVVSQGRHSDSSTSDGSNSEYETSGDENDDNFQHEQARRSQRADGRRIQRALDEIRNDNARLRNEMREGLNDVNDRFEELSDRPKYCYCNRGAYGEMVACDNVECPREWFHLGCTQLAGAPAEDEQWYCENCTVNAGERVTSSRGVLQAPGTVDDEGRPPPHAVSSEELVRDALVALGQSGLADQKTRDDDDGYSEHASPSASSVTSSSSPRPRRQGIDGLFDAVLPYTCTVCGKTFSRADERRRHMQSHRANEVRTYPCRHENCMMRFHHPKDEQRHYNHTHATREKYLCPYAGCKKEYASELNLDRHKLIMHPDDSELRGSSPPRSRRTSFSAHSDSGDISRD